MPIDYSELRRWEAALRKAGRAAKTGAKGVVSKGSLNIKNQAQRIAPGATYARLYRKSIAYDITVTAEYVEGEIGPTPGRPQWGLGNLLEYGSVNNQPHPHLEPSLDAEESRFEAAAEDLAEDLIVKAWEQ